VSRLAFIHYSNGLLAETGTAFIPIKLVKPHPFINAGIEHPLSDD
jgi:hypothetical protein